MKRIKNLIQLAIVVVLGMCYSQKSHAQFKEYDKVFDFDKFGYARVCNNYEKENQVMGLIDKNGKTILPLDYYDITVCEGKVAIVTECSSECEKGMKGLADLSTGKRLTPFNFYWIYSFDNGEALAETEQGNVVINTRGKVSRKLNFENPEMHGDGFILVRKDDGVMFYNIQGKPISNKIFDDAYHFADFFVYPEDGWMQVWEPYTSVHHDNLSYWLSSSGELLSHDEYINKVKKENDFITYDREMNEFTIHSVVNKETAKPHFKADDCKQIVEDRICVKRNGKWGFLDLQGKEVVPCIYDVVYSNFHEGLLLVRDAQNHEWFIDKDGKKVIDYNGIFAGYQYDAELRLARDGRNTTGASYSGSSFFSEGLAPYKSNWKVGFINKSGDVVIPAKYASVGPFKHGVAIVKDFNSEKYGMIDKEGNIVVECIYKACDYSDSEFAIVTLDNYKQTFVRLP